MSSSARTRMHTSIKNCEKTVFSLSRTIGMTTERHEESQQKNVFLPRKGHVLSFKWNYWPTLTTIFLKICKLFSKLINSTVKNMHRKSVESRQKDL